MPTNTPIRRVPRSVVRLFFGFLLLLGALLFRHYGVSWDEPTDHKNGMVSLRYIAEHVAPGWAANQAALQQVPPLENYFDNDHGVLFELPLALIDVLRPSTDPRPFYLLRHAVVFLMSLGGIWALFKLATLRFRDERLGLLAAGLFVLSPRFFGESFYNGKDLVFVAAFTLASYTLARLLARPTWRRALVHGLATAAAIDIRILAIILVPFTLTLLGIQFFSSAEPQQRRRLRQTVLAYLPALVIFIIIGWPYLWSRPLHNFHAAYRSMSHYQWQGGVLYLGNMVMANNLPWHYGLVWISITTPIAYQLAALLGLALVTVQLLRQPWATLRTLPGQLDLLTAGWLALPILLVIVFHSTIYDGWRHLYFVYPALLLMAVRGMAAVARLGRRGAGWRVLAGTLGLLAGAEAVLTAGRMAWMHPYEHQYFSYLPRKQAELLFERDYWGLSIRQGLEYLVAHQPTGPIYLHTTYKVPVENNLMWLSPADQARLVMVGDEHPGRYYISSYRSASGDYPASMGEEIYTIKADGVKILSILQRTARTPPPGVAW